MVGQQILDLYVGVRLPRPQPVSLNCERCITTGGFFATGAFASNPGSLPVPEPESELSGSGRVESRASELHNFCYEPGLVRVHGGVALTLKDNDL